MSGKNNPEDFEAMLKRAEQRYSGTMDLLIKAGYEDLDQLRMAKVEHLERAGLPLPFQCFSRR